MPHLLQSLSCDSRTHIAFSCRDVVEVLLRNDALTNVADCKGCYPLHLAAWKGDADIVKLLIHQGPSHTKVNEQVCAFFSKTLSNHFPRWGELLQLPPASAQAKSSAVKSLLLGQEGHCLKQTQPVQSWRCSE